MIYLSDDYLTKYIDTFGYVISRSIEENYSLQYIENMISHSRFIEEIEQSNITTIAFSSSEKIYHDVFPLRDNPGYFYDPYNQYGWISNIYIHLFLHYQITFELMFMIFPIQKMLELYKLYHEMDLKQIYSLFEETVQYSYLDNILKYKHISVSELSDKSGISFGTINALRYNKRDISKLESQKLFKISKALNIKMTSLLTSLELDLVK